MKYIVLLCLVTILSACVNSVQEEESVENTIQQENIQGSVAESHMTDEILIDETEVVTENRQGVRPAWTDYQQYASVNEEGFAYEIYNDPDISSEIFPLNQESSADVLLFTFDDAPQEPTSYAIDIAKRLKAKDVNAIFLVNGMYLEGEAGRQITKEVHDLGFEIGNHTQYHPYLNELTYEEQYQEILQTNQLIEEITGAPVRWFRPPFGIFNMDTVLICNELELQLITWTFGYDWMDEYLDGPSLAAVSLDNPYLKSGANILMHDRSWTLEAIDAMVDGYREQGYHIVDPYLIKHQENSTVVHGLADN